MLPCYRKIAIFFTNSFDVFLTFPDMVFVVFLINNRYNQVWTGKPKEEK
ncbi:hypothetical protein ANT_20610 [Anaerolinea thermophila UNI-1]|uniref:Uncharacterized protein n=1 Tax=Anaerolinea thermophila (strain DSM 14523 / JCM 11388 / NBRC 100420 / UNI-1) TaxID=926569 RepID=E8MXK6_ANATU|nr:hypothetical protein ANT_20610 [Anaerolinea thermophila UNI-1]